MEYIKISRLKPHPKNNFFFDDIKGEPWADFVDSIRDSNGPYDPIVITPDYVIVSGHQRVRACKLLGINEVQCTTRHFENDDMVLKALIETNIRQRGIGNPNPVKFGRCILELERIYGIEHGNNQHQEDSTKGGIQKTQNELIEELGTNRETYRRCKKTAQLPEEIQQAVTDGVITQSVASRVIAKLEPKEQEALAEKIKGKKDLSSNQIAKYINQISNKDDVNYYGMIDKSYSYVPSPDYYNTEKVIDWTYEEVLVELNCVFEKSCKDIKNIFEQHEQDVFNIPENVKKLLNDIQRFASSIQYLQTEIKHKTINNDSMN